MFCPQANVISPFTNSRSSTSIMTDTNGDGKHDVILEKDESGNTYLHLVMPASAVNFLNGSDGSSLFNFAEGQQDQGNYSGYQTNGGQDGDDFGEVFVELGCKVYEVNKVNYRGIQTDLYNSDAL